MTGEAAAGAVPWAGRASGWLRGSRAGLFAVALAGRRGVGSGRGRVPVPDLLLHLAGHRACRVRPAGPRRQCPPAVARAGVLRGDPGDRRPGLRAADLPLRPRGPRAWRARGDDRGRRGRRSDPAAGRRGQVGRLRGLHRGRRVGRPGGPDRADRRRAGLQPGPVGADAGEPAADPGRLRRGRRHRGHVQRADHRGVLRCRADPAGVLHRGDLHRDAVGDGRRPGQPGVPGQRPVPVRAAAGDRPAPRRQLPAGGGAGGVRGAARAGVQEHPVRDRGPVRPGLEEPPGVGPARGRRDRAGAAAARAAADVRRRLPGHVPGGRRRLRPVVPDRPGRREDDRVQPDHRHRRLRRGVRAVAVHRRHLRHGLRRDRQPRCSARPRASPPCTRSSAWARCSPPPPGPR